MIITNAMPQSAGMFSKKLSNALRPPAEAPIPTTGNWSVLRAKGRFFGVDGSRLVLIDFSAFEGYPLGGKKMTAIRTGEFTLRPCHR
jgi:hypothetical protein